MPFAPAVGDGATRIELADYLEAKIGLDERSLNRDVRRACLDRLASARGVIHWLDVGSGTGAMIRRLLAAATPASLSVTALDHDSTLLTVASAALAAQLERDGYRVLVHDEDIEAERCDRRIVIEFRRCGLFDFDPVPAARYDLVTAHAFMDIVPVANALSRFSAWLAPGGMLYASLNYDGDTALFPLYGDPDFESAVLREYDASMERRRLSGEPTGGARAGRRLHGALRDANFSVLAYGSSDWNITPVSGGYRDRDADVLHALLTWIHGESRKQPAIDPARLARWHAERMEQLEKRDLGIIVHQLDLLARLQGDGLTAFT
jgi:SAM-dependent methyltransferase